MNQPEIWRAVTFMIEEHGEAAPVQAAAYAEQLLALGDQEDFRLWKEVTVAIEGLHIPRDCKLGN